MNTTPRTITVILSTGTWWVPAEFFDRVVYREDFETCVPERWDDYLAYRYGDWRTPKSDWDFWRDDGALKQELPEKMVDLSGYGPRRGGLKAVRRQSRELLRHGGRGASG